VQEDHSGTEYGNVCRDSKSRNYKCPKGCVKTSNKKTPFCQTSSTKKAPCRVGMKKSK
jgi:hypothetical protein